MNMRKTLEVITHLATHGVIKEYAIAGAVAALSYLEPMLTEVSMCSYQSATWRSVPPGWFC